MDNREPGRFREMRHESLNDGVKGVTIDEEKVAKTLREVELSMKDIKGYEVGAIIGLDGTVIKAGIVGEKDSIRPPLELVKGNIFSHTHHNGMCNISDGDVIAFINDGGYEVRVVTSDGRFASLKKGDGVLNTSLGKDMKKVSRSEGFLEEVERRAKEKHGKPKLFQRNKELENMINGWLSNNAEKYGYIYTQGRHEL
jgi:hypothetical protein